MWTFYAVIMLCLGIFLHWVSMVLKKEFYQISITNKNFPFFVRKCGTMVLVHDSERPKHPKMRFGQNQTFGRISGQKYVKIAIFSLKFGGLGQSLARIDSAEIDRSFGFGRTLVDDIKIETYDQNANNKRIAKAGSFQHCLG